ncbi:hypothetical protein AAG906_029739 [Vitis piasezkii]
MRRLKHIGSICDYVKEFSSLMLEIPNMTEEEELLFNFMDNLQWEYSSKVESLEDNHATGGGDEEFTPKIKCFLCDGPYWARDCPKRKALSAMIEEREQKDEAHMSSM